MWKVCKLFKGSSPYRQRDFCQSWPFYGSGRGRKWCCCELPSRSHIQGVKIQLNIELILTQIPFEFVCFLVYRRLSFFFSFQIRNPKIVLSGLAARKSTIRADYVRCSFRNHAVEAGNEVFKREISTRVGHTAKLRRAICFIVHISCA